MKHKEYIGETFQEAVEIAKSELGEDIVIIESSEVESSGFLSGDKKSYKVIVSKASAESPEILKKKNLRKSVKELKIIDSAEDEIEFDSKEAAMRGTVYIGKELNSLNRYIKQLIFPELPEAYQNIHDRLLKSGMLRQDVQFYIKESFIDLNKKTRVTQNKVLEAVKNKTKHLFYPGRFTLDKPGKIIKALIGPTGSGKTMTLMKLAMHPEIFGKKKTAIISTDCYGIGANASLKSFTKLTTTPLAIVKNVDEMNQQLEKYKNHDAILIDTPGRSPYFPDYIKELSSYFNISESIDPILVLSSSQDVHDILNYYKFYSKIALTGVIFTKTDETARLGKIISVIKKIGLPVDFFTTGQTVPNDIKSGTSDFIWGKLVKYFNSENK